MDDNKWCPEEVLDIPRGYWECYEGWSLKRLSRAHGIRRCCVCVCVYGVCMVSACVYGECVCMVCVW